MQKAFRALPALEQIKLALQHRGYAVRAHKTTPDGLLILLSGYELSLIEIQAASSPNCQLFEPLLPLKLIPDDQQLQTLAPALAILNASFGPLNLVNSVEGLCLRSQTLHPRQTPDLKYLLELVKNFIKAWTYSYSLLSPYILGQAPFERLLIGAQP